MTPIEDIAAEVVPRDATPVPLVIASILRPEGTTGVHTHIRELCAHLDEKGLPYEIVTPFSWGRPLSTVIFSLRFPLNCIAPPASVAWYRHWHTAFLRAALRRRLQAYGRAVIYAHGPEAATASVQARNHPDQQVVMAVHFLRSQAGGWVTKGHISPGSRAVKHIELSERRLVPHLDGIVYVSRTARDEFFAAIPEARDIRSDIVTNFVRPLQLPPTPQPLGDLVTVGGLEKDKNQEFLLRVLAAARDAGHAYTLDIYGKGSLRRHLKGVAKRLGLTNQVRFRGYDAAVRSHLPAYRAYVHACAVETGPLAVIEALEAGLPVLAVNKGALGELLSDGIEGRYWNPDDPAGAAQVLITLLQNDKALEAAGRAAFRRFSTSFDASLIAPRLVTFLYDQHQRVLKADQRTSAGQA
jgi:glycosyltransferase involved in cell wall biosynthesis